MFAHNEACRVVFILTNYLFSIHFVKQNCRHKEMYMNVIMVSKFKKRKKIVFQQTTIHLIIACCGCSSLFWMRWYLGKKKEKSFVFFMRKTKSVLYFENSHVSLTSRTLTTNSFMKESATWSQQHILP